MVIPEMLGGENDSLDIEAKKENIQVVDNVLLSKQLKVSVFHSRQIPKRFSRIVTSSIQAPVPSTNATKLRRPTNWTGAAKVANGAASGIPRPASRIPAPKFSRPNLK